MELSRYLKRESIDRDKSYSGNLDKTYPSRSRNYVQTKVRIRTVQTLRNASKGVGGSKV